MLKSSEKLLVLFDKYGDAIKELARLGKITVDNTVTGKITKI